MAQICLCSLVQPVTCSDCRRAQVAVCQQESAPAPSPALLHSTEDPALPLAHQTKLVLGPDANFRKKGSTQPQADLLGTGGSRKDLQITKNPSSER